MALFELIATIFSLSTLLSLMGKRRASTDEAGPSRPTRPRKKTGAEASTSAEQERRSKRDLNPLVPIERSLPAGIELGRFCNRRVVFEAHVDEKLFGLLDEYGDEIEEESEEEEGSEDEEDNDEEGSGKESTEEGSDEEEQEEEEGEAQDLHREPPTATHDNRHDRAALEACMAQIEENQAALR
ncbi:uncharacterized protein LOC131247024 [Magnolia sinica]|uniref:uncharacterized protein LOC131247024 n=1 Tax=Magnolia sinica TaxID=86752 RepID=UPI0026585AA7|nr:uncharacterized protein LOC131247024 [Magnolia sinica]